MAPLSIKKQNEKPQRLQIFTELSSQIGSSHIDNSLKILIIQFTVPQKVI